MLLAKYVINFLVSMACFLIAERLSNTFISGWFAGIVATAICAAVINIIEDKKLA